MSDPIDPGMVMDSIPPETKFDENPPPVVKLPVSAGNTPAPISEPATIPAENPVVAPPAGKTIVPRRRRNPPSGDGIHWGANAAGAFNPAAPADMTNHPEN